MLHTLLVVISILLLLASLRIFYLVSRSGRVDTNLKRTQPCRTLIILGSGGHTAEMLRLVGGMSPLNYSPRVYVVAESDKMSAEKVERFESTSCSSTADVRKIPRARHVRQSYWTSIPSTLMAASYSFPLVMRMLPDLVLCNGPGTCIPICFWAYMLKFLMLRNVTIVYVESMCRVERLSLSGLLLYFVADHLLVQWPQLKERYPRTKYIGRLV